MQKQVTPRDLLLTADSPLFPRPPQAASPGASPTEPRPHTQLAGQDAVLYQEPSPCRPRKHLSRLRFLCRHPRPAQARNCAQPGEPASALHPLTALPAKPRQVSLPSVRCLLRPSPPRPASCPHAASPSGMVLYPDLSGWRPAAA